MRTAKCTAHFSVSWFDHRNNIRLGVQLIMLLTLQYSPFHCCFVRVSPRYFYKRPVLIQPQPTFLPQCKRPHFPLISNNQQNYRSVCFNISIWIVKRKTTDSASNDSSNSRVQSALISSIILFFYFLGLYYCEKFTSDSSFHCTNYTFVTLLCDF